MKDERDIAALPHAKKTLKGSGHVLALNTGSIITPEAQAMLGALHSRSIGGIESHLEVLAKRGSDNFMSIYYVGYGHKSIGDLGSATLFIEGVSMLAAKAIQDWPLYNGQESSTRYIDFAQQPFINPLGTKKGEETLEKWRTFYLKGLEVLVPELKKRHPIGEGEKESVYDKAINARAFDIMRGFLPAGASTNLAWHGNLRQFADKLLVLRHHPLDEVKDIAGRAEEALIEAFPNSFGAKRYDETENYNKTQMEALTYFEDEHPIDFELSQDAVNRKMLSRYRNVLSKRPPKTELPKIIGECGMVTFRFLLDFGSFRDIQRHRAVFQQMPLLTTSHGFHPWYMEELPEDFQKEAKEVLGEQEKAISSLECSREEKQYYTAMGYQITNQLTGNLPALIYLVELRATRFVHPTLRFRAQEMAHALKKKFSEDGLVIHLDEDSDRFDIKRGEQDIVQKEN
ncbi:MAG: FAD-dependent thymidylate synthase [Candidatus Paceibacterota bacterium]